MSRLDELRSWVRRTAGSVSGGLEKLGALTEARRVLKELGQKRLLVPESAIGAAIARAPGVESASARVRDGVLLVDAYFSDGEHLEARFEPAGTTFAPRGPKEIAWRIAPQEALHSRHLLDVAGALCATVAHILWAVVLPRETPDASGGALVDRDGSGVLRADLRNVPAVRERLGESATAAVIEVLELAGIDFVEGEMRLELRIPMLG